MTDEMKKKYESECAPKADAVIAKIKSAKFTQNWKGYDTVEVDDFLDDIIELMENHKCKTSMNTMIDLTFFKDAKFKRGFRGYDIEGVDVFMKGLHDDFVGINQVKLMYRE